LNSPRWCIDFFLFAGAAKKNDDHQKYCEKWFQTFRYEEAASKVNFYRRGAEAQKKYKLIINSLRLCVSAVIKKIPF
jgi:hypothetical protein